MVRRALPSQESIHGAVRQLYAATVEPAAMPAALKAMARLIGAPLLTLDSYFHGPERLVATGLRYDSDYDAAMIGRYIDYIGVHENPRMAWAFGRHGYGAVDDLEIFDAHVLATHPFFNELLREFRLPYNRMADVGHFRGYGFALAAHFETKAGLLAPRGRQLFELFRGHVVEAVEIMCRLAQRRGGSADLVRHGDAPRFFIGRDGHVLAMDERVFEVLRHHRELSVVGGELRCTDLDAHAAVHAAITQALHHRSGDLAARASSLVQVSPRLALQVEAVMWAEEVPLLAHVRLELLETWGRSRLRDQLARSGLTAAEIDVCKFYHAGRGSLKDYARVRHRAIETVRSHLKGAFRKLDVHSQLALQQRLNALAPTFDPGR